MEYNILKTIAGSSAFPLNSIKNFILKLRLEELIALIFFPIMTYFTFKAFFYFQSIGESHNIITGAVWRWAALIAVIGLLYTVAKYKPNWRIIRDGLPFGICIAIYTNLHDTVHFVNPHDVHFSLIAIDDWLFGVQPCMWAQQFYHPVLTEFFSFCYVNFFIFAPLVAAILWFQKKYRAFRYVMITTILCFYTGYILYVLFPAAPPRYVLINEFTRTFSGGIISRSTDSAINAVLPQSSRCAFPSLHAAVTTLSLIFAYRYLRWLFWILLPFGIGLILATVYLRHHYVIDLIAGFALCFLTLWYAPKLEDWWNRKRERAGIKEPI